jgi:protein SCO1/2
VIARLHPLLFLLAIFLGRSLPAQTVLDTRLQTIDFEQRLGQQVSLDLPFRDEAGRAVTLRDYFHGKPIVFVPGYYGCPMLCRALATGLTNALRDLPWTIGNQFEVVSFSIDPHETSALAEQKKRSYLKAYGRPGAESGWHFLTGDEPAIRGLAGQIGFHYFYDAASKQFAHPSGLVVLTPSGRVSHYLFGVNFATSELDNALRDASGARIGPAIRRLILLCFHYQPLTGRYSFVALWVLRGTALVLLALLGLWIASALRSERSRIGKASG